MKNINNNVKSCLGTFGLTVVALALAACATTSYSPAAVDSRNELVAAHLAATNGVPVTAESQRAIEDRILALDPDRISDADVRNSLAAGPTPRIVLVHGGIAGVYLMMESFGKFLVGMGYPEARIRDPRDGEWSQNPYRSSERLAGQLAWYYERDGVRPMLIGHSQGGMQTVKVLHELAGDFGDRVPVWNPVSDKPENRQTIYDPMTRAQRPVIGLKLSYASVVGAGGLGILGADRLEPCRTAALDSGQRRGIHRLLDRRRSDCADAAVRRDLVRSVPSDRQRESAQRQSPDRVQPRDRAEYRLPDR